MSPSAPSPITTAITGSDPTLNLSPRRALLLDFDGTVADTHELIFDCLDATARAHLQRGFPRPLWEEHLGRPLREVFSLLGDDVAERMDFLIHDYRARQERCSGEVEAFPGMAEALTQLHSRGIRLAIVTTKTNGIARRQLSATGLAPLFDVVVGFDDCLRPKPDPEPFRRALEQLNVPPEEAVGIGDTPLDIRSARGAGLLTLGAFWGRLGHAELLAAEPDRVLRHPEELLSLPWRTTATALPT